MDLDGPHALEHVGDRGVDRRAEERLVDRPEGVAAELAAAGLRQTDWWTDPAGDFGLSLAVKPDLRT